MWDNNAPLQLLKTMPSRLNQEHLEKIQMLIDADKYKNSIISGFDLCGIFAPFCRGCDRTSIYPCAVSYIRMLQSEGMNIEIDASPSYFGAAKTYSAPIEISQPHTKHRVNTVSYEQHNIRKQIDNKYKDIKKRPNREIKNEIAVTEDESSVQPVITEEKVVEKKLEIKQENSVAKQPVVNTANDIPSPRKSERIEHIEPLEKKADGNNKLRIAVARRKLNF